MEIHSVLKPELISEFKVIDRCESKIRLGKGFFPLIRLQVALNNRNENVIREILFLTRRMEKTGTSAFRVLTVSAFPPALLYAQQLCRGKIKELSSTRVPCACF